MQFLAANLIASPSPPPSSAIEPTATGARRSHLQATIARSATGQRNVSRRPSPSPSPFQMQPTSPSSVFCSKLQQRASAADVTKLRQQASLSLYIPTSAYGQMQGETDPSTHTPSPSLRPSTVVSLPLSISLCLSRSPTAVRSFRSTIAGSGASKPSGTTMPSSLMQPNVTLLSPVAFSMNVRSRKERILSSVLGMVGGSSTPPPPLATSVSSRSCLRGTLSLFLEKGRMVSQIYSMLLRGARILKFSG